MSYEIIEKNEYGTLVKNTTNNLDCFICKYQELDLNVCIDYCGGGSNKYYLQDSEADSQKELLDLQIENKKLKEKIKELENNTTELIPRSGDLTHDYWYYCQECLQDLETDNYNFCPNCGRKIIR